MLDNEDYKDFHHELSRRFKKYKPNDEVISQAVLKIIGITDELIAKQEAEKKKDKQEK